MNVCLIGNGISTLILATVLANRNVKVSIYGEHTPMKNFSTRTLGVSKNNFDYLKKENINIEKRSWKVNGIKIFNEIRNNKEILNFDSGNNEIFFIIKYSEFFNLLYKKLKKNKFIKQYKIKNLSFFNSILNEKDNYDLIINFDAKNIISKKLFFKRYEKDYKTSAFTSLIEHDECNNKTARQIFTKFGPLAFLPCSNQKTSIVFSILDQNKIISDKKIQELILNYNNKYKIKKFGKFEKFKIKSSILKNYYYKKILCFGDNLHKIHPLAGQGLNMTIRDIKILLNIIDFRINLGLQLDSSILHEFQNKSKHYNYLFSTAIDFIHDFFKYDNKFNNLYSKKLFNFLEYNNIFKKYSKKFADKGIFY